MKIPIMLENESQPLYSNSTLSDFDIGHNYSVRHSLYLSDNFENNGSDDLDRKLDAIKNETSGKVDCNEKGGKEVKENSHVYSDSDMNDLYKPLGNGITPNNFLYNGFNSSSLIYEGGELEMDKDSKDMMMLNLENAAPMTCFFCKKVYNDPRLLFCLHTFCYSCIEKILIKSYPSLASKFHENDKKEPYFNGVHETLSCDEETLNPYKSHNDLSLANGNLAIPHNHTNNKSIKVTCPVCLHKTQIFYKNIESIRAELMNNLPINFVIHDSLILTNLKEKVNSLVGSLNDNQGRIDVDDKELNEEDILCTSCRGPSFSTSPHNNLAVARCLDCASYLCEVCVQAHYFMHCFENHCVMTFKQIHMALQSGNNRNKIGESSLSSSTSSRPLSATHSVSNSSKGSSPNLSCNDDDRVDDDPGARNKVKLLTSLRYVVKCKQHPVEVVKFYCNPCQVLVCSLCHESHQIAAHTCFPLDSNMELKERNEIACDLAAAKSKVSLLESKITQYQNKLTSLENQQESIKYKLKDTQEACKDMIDSYFNKMLDALSDMHSSFELKVMEAYHDVEKLFESFEDGTKFVDNLLAHSNLPEILVLKPIIKSRLNMLSQSLLPFHENVYCAIEKLDIHLPFGAQDLENFLQTKLLDAFLDQHKKVELAPENVTIKVHSTYKTQDNLSPSSSNISCNVDPLPLVLTKVDMNTKDLGYINKDGSPHLKAEDKEGIIGSNVVATNPAPIDSDLTPLGNINPSSALANNIMGLAALAKLGNIGFDNNLLINDIGLLSQSLENGLQPISNQSSSLENSIRQPFMSINLSSNALNNASRYMNGNHHHPGQNSKFHDPFLPSTDLAKHGISSLLPTNNLSFNHDSTLQHQTNNLASNLSRLLTLSASTASLLPTPPSAGSTFQCNNGPLGGNNCGLILNHGGHGSNLQTSEQHVALLSSIGQNGPSGYNALSPKDFSASLNAANFNLSAAALSSEPYNFNHMNSNNHHQPPPNTLSLINSTNPSAQGYNPLHAASSSLHLSAHSPLESALLSPGMFMNSPPPPPFGLNYVPPMRSGEVNKMSIMKVRVKFGSLGPGNLQFNSPHGFCLGMDEEIIVADTNNHRIQVYAKTGAFKGQFGIPGRDEGQLWYPRKVAVNKINGKFIVCDRGNERSRMQIFDRNGNFLKKVPIRYIDIVAGLAITEVGSPGGAGHIVAVDSVSPTVFRIAESGDLLHWFDCSEYMREPSDVAVRADEYYVCDFKGHCVAVFAESGQFLRRIGRETLTNFPNGIDVSEGGEVLVGDSHGNRFHVAVFRGSDGTFLAEFECPHVKVSRCCGLKITTEGYVVTLAKNNHYVLVLDTLFVPP